MDTGDGKPAWLLVNGDFTRRGGQEFANHALATRLVTMGRTITLVAHAVDPSLSSKPNVRTVLVRRPLGSYFLGERALEWAARREQRLMSRTGRVILLGNGGNCPMAEVSWAHFIHAAWTGTLSQAPFQARVFSRLKKEDALARERRAFRQAALIVANSEKTTRDLTTLLGVHPEKVVRIWFGADALTVNRASSSAGPNLLFVGALGWDSRKGLDTALRAFALLVRETDFRHRLVVAGAGIYRPWKSLAARLGVADRVEFLSFVDNVGELLAAADILVCPTRYEPYGLAVQEAIMAGVPPLVSSGTAGITDRFPASLQGLLVREVESPRAWADQIRTTLLSLREWQTRTRAASATFGERSWNDFADEFIETVESRLASSASKSRKRL
jgi:glycosyltransferase involved in cell wall biosynthesis